MPPSEADVRGISPRVPSREGNLIVILVVLTAVTLASLALLGSIDLNAHSVKHLTSASADSADPHLAAPAPSQADEITSRAAPEGLLVGTGSMVLLCLCAFFIAILGALVVAARPRAAVPNPGSPPLTAFVSGDSCVPEQDSRLGSILRV